MVVTQRGIVLKWFDQPLFARTVRIVPAMPQIAQPTLSRTMKRPDNMFGAALFSRTFPPPKIVNMDRTFFRNCR